MKNHTSMESEDVQDFCRDAMTKQFSDMDDENESCQRQDWKDGGHSTDATSTTCMSDDDDQDDDVMIDAEGESTHFIDTESLDPPIVFTSQGAFSKRNRHGEWSTSSAGKENQSLASLFDDPMKIPTISMGLNEPSQAPNVSMCHYSDSNDYLNDCSEMAPTMFDSFDQIDLPLPAPSKNMPAFPMPHRFVESKLNSCHTSMIMVQSTSKKQIIDSMQVTWNRDKSNSVKIASCLGQMKRCRPLEPLENECIEIMIDNDVLFGQHDGNGHSGTKVYFQEQIQQHQSNYKRLKVDIKTKMAIAA